MGMNSINTNIAAMTALQSLQQTSKDMLTTQSRISTGLRVASASDNAAYWSIATTMRSDNDALSTVQDALGLGKGTVERRLHGDEQQPSTSSRRSKTSWSPPRRRALTAAKIQSEINELQNQLKGVADSASFSGENWLSVDSSGDRLQRDEVDRFLVHAHASGAVSIGNISVRHVEGRAVRRIDAQAPGGILDASRGTTGAIGRHGRRFRSDTSTSARTDRQRDRPGQRSIGYIRPSSNGVPGNDEGGDRPRRQPDSASTCRRTSCPSLMDSITSASRSSSMLT